MSDNSPFLSPVDNADAHRNTAQGDSGKAAGSATSNTRVNVIIDGNSSGGDSSSLRRIHNGNGQHLSSFQRMVERSPSYIDVTLSIETETNPGTGTRKEQQGAILINTSTSIQMTKRDKIRREWEETCLKWGFVVVRQLTYIQKTCADIMPEGDADRDINHKPIKQEEAEAKQSSESQSQSQSTIIVNGYPATKEKDELLVSMVQPRSTADVAGLVKGDAIHSVYGMKDPTLSLLFGIMRDSTKFVVKVERMESHLEREMREKQMDCLDLNANVTANVNVTANESADTNTNPNTNPNTVATLLFVPIVSVAEELINMPMGGDDMKNMKTATASLQSKSDLQVVGSASTRIDTFGGNQTTSYKNVDAEKAVEKNTSFTLASQPNVLDINRSQNQPSIARENPSLGSINDIATPESTSGPGSRGSFSPQEILATQLPNREKEEKRSRNEAAPVEGAASFKPLKGRIAKKKCTGKQNMTSNDNCVRKGLELSSLDRPEVQDERNTRKVAKSRSNSFSHNGRVEEETNPRPQPGVEAAINYQSQSAKGLRANDKDVQMVDELFLDSHVAQHETGGSEIQDSRNSSPTGEDEVREEESLLTMMIEKSITNELKHDGPSRDKKLKAKVSKRKLSEDSAADKKDKVSKSNRKKERRQSEDESAKNDDEMQTEKSKKKRKKDRKVSEDLTKSKKLLDEKLSIADKGKDSSESGAISSGKPPSDNRDREAKLSEVQSNNTQQKQMSGNSIEAEVVITRRSNSVTSIDWGADSDSQSRTRQPSPLTVPRQNSKTIASTSSKAGLGSVKSAKLKRLWPDSSVFSKRILKWSPPKVVMEDFKVCFKGSVKSSSKSKLPVVPATFRDTSELIKFMSPHILEEGIHSVNQEFMANSNRNGLWTRAAFSMHLRHCTPVDSKPTSSSMPSVRTYEFAFSLDASNDGLQPPCNLGEIFAVHSPSWKQPCCLGIIGSNDINNTFLADQKIDDDDSYDLIKIWICVSSESVEGSGWLPESDMPPKNPDGSFPTQMVYLLNIGTSTDMMRQYEGLKSLACLKTNLKRAIYSDGEGGSGNIIDELPSEMPARPSSVCSHVWNHLNNTTNPYQLGAIEKIMSGKVKENIALMQGPPGTGKTSTTVALVSALLNGSAPVPGAKTSGTRVQIGRALQSSNSDLVMHDATVSRRILVCAPSNQAVDELAWKIHKNAIGGNGKVGGFNMVRFGMVPGEDRHDGRGKRSSQRATSFSGNDRDIFLSAINLDKMVRDVASGKETHDFRHTPKGKKKQSPMDSSRKSRYINFNAERQKILSQCHVVCTTLSGAGSKAFIESVTRDEFPHFEFDAVIIDEACQGSEMSTLIPFKYNPNVVILVGDPNQLPVMSFSPDASRCNADRSLFDRLHANGWPVNMLRIQYRMHPSIVSFPSKTFYNNNLITCDLIKNRSPAQWHDHIAFPPYLLWNMNGGMSRGSNGGIWNMAEATFVVNLLKGFARRYPGIRNIDIGIISFYNDQVARIKDKMKDKDLLRWMNSNNVSVQVSTVDGFQGSEKDIIILSCVRSRWEGSKVSKDIGFLKDFRRVNVALTRAKYSLWVVANCDMLSKDPLWNSLIEDAHVRNLISESRNLSTWMEEDTIRKPKSKKWRKGGRKGKSNNNKMKKEE